MYDHTDQSAAAAAAFFLSFMGIIAVMVLILMTVIIYLYWRIAEKAGYNGAWSLLTLVPGGHLVLLILFAVLEWPVQAELAGARLALRGSSAPPPAPPAPMPPPAPQTIT